MAELKSWAGFIGRASICAAIVGVQGGNSRAPWRSNPVARTDLSKASAILSIAEIFFRFAY
jgi:hypothetical protein